MTKYWLAVVQIEISLNDFRVIVKQLGSTTLKR